MENDIYRKVIIGIAYFYVSFPIMLFFGGWMKWYYSIPAILIVALAFCSSMKAKMFFWVPELNRRNVIALVLIVLVCGIWVYWSGVGGFVAQNSDHWWRNEIFSLLVNEKWPVVISCSTESGMSHRMMSYYIGFWLPSALVGKIFGYQLGYAFQYIWALLGVVLVVLLMISLIQRCNLLLPIGFILFSGMDALGFRILGGDLSDFTLHLEWWSGFQFSSHTTQLFWVFNQAIYGWLILMLILLQENNRVIVWVLGCALLSCTFPFVGVLPYFLYRVIQNGTKKVKETGVRSALKDLFTWENILGGGVTGLLSFMYLRSNTSAQKSGIVSVSDMGTFVHYALFCVCEFGILMFLLLWKEKKSVAYWITLFVFVVSPLIRIGGAGDFCMRVSIPALVVLYMMTYQTLEHYIRKRVYVLAIAIATVFLIGTITPLHEMYRTKVATDNAKSLGGELVLYVAEEDIMCADNFSCDVDESRFAQLLMKTCR